MEQYGLSFLCLSAVFVGWSICKYMIKRWATHDHIQTIAQSLQAIQARLDSTRIDGVCVCHACASASLADTDTAIGVVESRRASVVSLHVNSKSEVAQNVV